jgi:hypothetical protein
MEQDIQEVVGEEQVPVDQEAQEPQEPRYEPPEQEVEPEEAPKPATRKLKFVTSEFDLPAELPDDVFSKVEEVSEHIKRGMNEKFREAAALRQQAEQERQSIVEWRAQQEQEVAQHTELAALRHNLKQYDGVNWFDAISNAPDEETRQRIRDLRDQVSSTKERATVLEQEIKQTNEQRKAQESTQHQRLFQHFENVGEQILRQQIKDWGPEKKALVVQALKDYGVGNTHPMIDQAALFAASYHPAVVAAFHDAALYRRGLKKATADSKPEAPKPQPVSKVGGSATPVAKDPDKMSTEEWLRWRTAQVKRRA